REKLLEEAELRRLAVRPARSGRQVHADHGDLGEMRFEVSPFRVELAAAEPLDDARRDFRVDGDAAVALARGRKKRRVRAAWRAQRARDVVVRRLDLLQAHDVPRFGTAEPAREAAPLGRPYSVDIERDDAHVV